MTVAVIGQHILAATIGRSAGVVIFVYGSEDLIPMATEWYMLLPVFNIQRYCPDSDRFMLITLDSKDCRRKVPNQSLQVTYVVVETVHVPLYCQT